MTPQLIEPGNNNIDVELDRLAYYAYLLTLGPDLALSVVTAAIDTSMTHLASRHDLLQRTIEISLAQFRLESSAASDRESLAVAGLLFSDSSLATSTLALSLKEHRNGNPILLLESGARIAFISHHVLGYGVKVVAAIGQISEKAYHTELRKAFLQLAFAPTGKLCGRRQYARAHRAGIEEI